MKIGIAYPQIELRGDPDAVRKFGRAVEDLGFHHLLAYDHVVGAEHANRVPELGGRYSEKDPFHDPFMMFSHLASLTKTLRFATGVLVLPQRQTVLVAKQAADLDLLSGGRFRMGVSVGWNYVEYQALGQDFKSRGRRLDEQIVYLRKLWTKPLVAFNGDFDRIDRGGINPLPKQPIPIWVGGFSEAAYRRGGLLGDGFIFGRDFSDVRDGLKRVEHFLRESGRPTETFGKELIVQQNEMDLQATVDRIFEWRDLGGTHACVVTMNRGLKGVDAHIEFIDQLSRRLNSQRA